MNRQFLEFWGNFLLQVAKGQKQMEDLAKWSRLGFSSFGELTALFQKAYGLDELPEDSPEYLKIWKKAEEDFRRSFKDYLSLMGAVPREEYVELARKYEELKEKVADQEETIKHLRMLLSEKGLDCGAVTLEFQKMMKKQTDQFHKLVKDWGKAVKEGGNED
jgi:hypothetical protein